MALAAKNRLKRELDFKRVLKSGRTVRGDFLFIKYYPNDLNVPRFGISVSAKISKKAVDRNKMRRLISETIRLNILPKSTGCDTVVVVTKSFLKEGQLINEDIQEVFEKAKII